MVKDLEEEILSETKSNLDTPTDSSIIIPSSNPQLSNSKVAKASNSVPVLQPKMNPSNIILSRSAPLSAPASISKPTRSLGLAFPQQISQFLDLSSHPHLFLPHLPLVILFLIHYHLKLQLLQPTLPVPLDSIVTIWL